MNLILNNYFVSRSLLCVAIEQNKGLGFGIVLKGFQHTSLKYLEIMLIVNRNEPGNFALQEREIVNIIKNHNRSGQQIV